MKAKKTLFLRASPPQLEGTYPLRREWAKGWLVNDREDEDDELAASWLEKRGDEALKRNEYSDRQKEIVNRRGAARE
jgi:hypothetical protein